MQLQAAELRKKGFSLKRISSELGVAKSSVSLWVRDLELPLAASELIQSSYTNGQRASQIALRARTSVLLAAAKQDAETLVQQNIVYSEQALIICSLLYWCEGGKRPNDSDLTFSNSDPALVAAYLSLLRLSIPLDESKFRVLMHLHEYHDEPTQLKFWSHVTEIPEQQFTKTYWKPHTGKRMRKNYPGCIHIGYHDVRVSRKVSATARAFLAQYFNKGL